MLFTRVDHKDFSGKNGEGIMLNELKRTYEYYLLMQPLAFGLCQEYLL